MLFNIFILDTMESPKEEIVLVPSAKLWSVTEPNWSRNTMEKDS